MLRNEDGPAVDTARRILPLGLDLLGRRQHQVAGATYTAGERPNDAPVSR
jgi:hypothetical protein